MAWINKWAWKCNGAWLHSSLECMVYSWAWECKYTLNDQPVRERVTARIIYIAQWRTLFFLTVCWIHLYLFEKIPLQVTHAVLADTITPMLADAITPLLADTNTYHCWQTPLHHCWPTRWYNKLCHHSSTIWSQYWLMPTLRTVKEWIPWTLVSVVTWKVRPKEPLCPVSITPVVRIIFAGLYIF